MRAAADHTGQTGAGHGASAGSDLPGILPGPPQECPGCGEPHPLAVFDGSRTNFLCRRCGSSWHVGMGYIWLVDAGSSPS
ncbi:MAG TPA: hypothetical protein VFH45_06370 [Acidimicrobiales bacterium]|nr:hypothetical protein [Acidimicrobiales bacterium]